MKRLIAIVATVLLVGAVGTSLYAWHRVTGYLDAPISAAGGETAVTIPKGAHFKRVVAILAEVGVVEDPLVFEIYGRALKADANVRAGDYRIDLAQTPRALLNQLREGGLIPQVRVTIPEGLNRWEVADLLSRKGLVERAKFLERVADDDLEGRLFPDTYWIREGATLDEVVRVLTERFEQVLEEILRPRPAQQTRLEDPKARRDFLILASLVEKEARTDRDRFLVSRVFHNRIERGMKFETDPTCVYGADTYQETPHPRFCRDPRNTYSTYVIEGLPPGPIANPGRAAMIATLEPATGKGTEKLLFFVARRDGTGEHHFSATYAEHAAAVDRYLKRKR